MYSCYSYWQISKLNLHLFLVLLSRVSRKTYLYYTYNTLFIRREHVDGSRLGLEWFPITENELRSHFNDGPLYERTSGASFVVTLRGLIHSSTTNEHTKNHGERLNECKVSVVHIWININRIGQRSFFAAAKGKGKRPLNTFRWLFFFSTSQFRWQIFRLSCRDN